MSGRTEASFLAALKGIHAHHVTAAMNLLTPGTNWTGCSKSYMAERWAGTGGWKGPVEVSINELAAMAKARHDGNRDWMDAK